MRAHFWLVPCLFFTASGCSGTSSTSSSSSSGGGTSGSNGSPISSWCALNGTATLTGDLAVPTTLVQAVVSDTDYHVQIIGNEPDGGQEDIQIHGVPHSGDAPTGQPLPMIDYIVDADQPGPDGGWASLIFQQFPSPGFYDDFFLWGRSGTLEATQYGSPLDGGTLVGSFQVELALPDGGKPSLSGNFNAPLCPPI